MTRKKLINLDVCLKKTSTGVFGCCPRRNWWGEVSTSTRIQTDLVSKRRNTHGCIFWSSKKLLVFGALTSEHKFFYEFYDAQNSLTFCCFLRTFIQKLNKKRKYVFILDNVGYHKTSPVMNLLNEFPFISVEFLPTYSPELNPIETCWKVTKNAVTKSQFFPTLDAVKQAL